MSTRVIMRAGVNAWYLACECERVLFAWACERVLLLLFVGVGTRVIVIIRGRVNACDCYYSWACERVGLLLFVGV